jgi:hypothetical protein
MAGELSSPQDITPSLVISSASTITSASGMSLSSAVAEKKEPEVHERNVDGDHEKHSRYEAPGGAEENNGQGEDHLKSHPTDRRPISLKIRKWLGPKGKLRPFRLLRQDINNIKSRYISDWMLFNQLVFASAVYVFFTNILPGITFASDLYVLTGHTWGTIEVVFSTGLCGLIFSM